MLLLFLFTFLTLFHCISTDPYKCDGNHVIDPPADINTAWYYPDGWTETQDPLPYAQNQTCLWKINVPKGMYAFLTLTGETNITTLTVTDSVGNQDWVNAYFKQEPYFLLNPQFMVYLQSNNGTGTFGMKVIWKKIGAFNPSFEKVLPDTVPIVKSSSNCDNGLVIDSNSAVSLVSVRPPPTDQLTNAEINLQMRNTVVFDGPTIDDKLIGNLWQIEQKDNQVVSSGKYLTLYSLRPNIKTDSYALIQDFQNVKQFTVYKGVSCFNQDLCAVIIDARVGLGAAVRMSPEPHFLKNLYMTEDSKMTVYTGTISPDHQVAQYTLKTAILQCRSEISRCFHGVFTTYTLDQNIAIAYLSSDRLDTNWTSITDGRTGIFASKNYGVVSKDQNIQEAFSGASTDIFEMTLNTKSSGLTDRATLTVTVTSGGKSVFDEKYTSQRFPPATITANGNGLIVKYDTNGSETTGMLMDFSFKLEMSGGTTISPYTPSTKNPTPETTTKYGSRCFSIIVLLSSIFMTFIFE